MFKEPEKGNKDINVERTEEALETEPKIIAAGCPFCNTMMTDGVKAKEREADVTVMDIAELIANAQDLQYEEIFNILSFNVLSTLMTADQSARTNRLYNNFVIRL